MQLRPDQSVLERQKIIEDALAEVLDRDGNMSVEWDFGDRYVYVVDGPHSDARAKFPLEVIARELELLLS